MKAAVLHEFGAPLAMEDVTLAAPGPEDVRVRITACAICHSDVRAIAGGWGGRLPVVYGHEAAGVILEAGARTGRLRAGDTVVVNLVRHCGACPACARSEPMLCGSSELLDHPGPLSDGEGGRITQGFRTGAFAEEAVVHCSQAVRVPPSLPPECASLLGCGVLTGFGAAVNTAGIRAGESTAVFGTGGVGINCVQGAAIAGAEMVIAVDTSDSKLALAATLGATHTINPLREDAPAWVRDLTGGGVDCSFATVVVDPVFGAAYGCLRRGGRMVVVGMADDGAIVSLDPTTLSDHGVRILGPKMGGGHPLVDIPTLATLHASGWLKLEALVSGRHPLHRINEALDECREGTPIRNVILF